MTNHHEYGFNPDLGLDDEIAGVEMAAAIGRLLSDDSMGGLSVDQLLTLQECMAPGLAHFHALAREAGRLAAAGDVIGAFTLMGGVENARELIGDEAVDELLAELDQDPDAKCPDTLA